MDKPWLEHYEPGVRPHLDYPSVPMHHFLEQAAANSPNAVATIYGNVVHQLGGRLMDAKLTYRQLNEQVNRLANALIAMGVKKGDRVALYLPNCPQYIISYYAVLKA